MPDLSQPVALANAASFVLTALLVAFIFVKRPAARNVRNLLLLLLLGILIWSGGAVWRALAPNHAQIIAAHNLVFLGVILVPTVWVLLAAAATRLELLERRPSVKAWIVAPGIFFYLTCVTNEGHQLFARIDYQQFDRRIFFWAMIAWAFLCSTTGTMLFLRRARLMAMRDERQASALLATSGLIPLISSASYLFQWIAWPIDPTPSALGVSAALLYPVVLRLRTFEDLPLVRQDVIEHLHDAVVIANPAGRVVDVNPTAQQLFPRGRRLRGQPLSKLIAELCADPDMPTIGKWLAQEGPAEFVTRDERSLRLRATSVLGHSGNSIGRYVILQDCSQERQAERSLRQAQKLESIGMRPGSLTKSTTRSRTSVAI